MRAIVKISSEAKTVTPACENRAGAYIFVKKANLASAWLVSDTNSCAQWPYLGIFGA